MRRWPVVLALLTCIALLWPAQAGAARTKTLKVRAPAEGAVNLVAFRFKAPAGRRPRLSLGTRRGLGDLRIVGAVRKRRGRNWEGAVFVSNPRSGSARASQGATIAFRLVTPTIAHIANLAALMFPVYAQHFEARRRAAACDGSGVLTRPGSSSFSYSLHGGRDLKSLFGAQARYACQSGSGSQIARAQDLLTRTRIDAPECSGTVLFADQETRAFIRGVCGVHTTGLITVGQNGNRATACNNATGLCAAGPPACPTPESACFDNPSGFPQRTVFGIDVTYGSPLSSLAVGFKRAGGSLESVYLRHER
jgi:hypothetical protein